MLTDNLDELVEVLEANTGERATALDAVGEPIEMDVQVLARRIPQKAPLWTPGEEWAAVEARARREGTVAFRADGYDALMERVRALAEQPDLPAATRKSSTASRPTTAPAGRGTRRRRSSSGCWPRMPRRGVAWKRRPERPGARSPGWRGTGTGARSRRG